MTRSLRVDTVLACVSAIVLVAATVGDWYLVRVVAGLTSSMHGSSTIDGVTHTTSMSMGIDTHGDFMRMAVSPWYGDKPLAIGLVALSVASVAAIVLGEAKKVDARLASVAFVVSA